MPSTETVTIHILEKDYQVACKTDERENLLKAAAELDHRMRDIRTNSSVIGMDRIAVIAALNLADELIKLRQYQTRPDEKQLLAQLHQRLDKVLPQPEER